LSAQRAGGHGVRCLYTDFRGRSGIPRPCHRAPVLGGGAPCPAHRADRGLRARRIAPARPTGLLMPEGHSVHRIARQFDANYVGRVVAASSPQGRFAEGAAVISGRTATRVRAQGKQMFLEFDDELWLRVHLGIYGAWDFSGEIVVDPTIASANGRMGQTNQRGTDLEQVFDDAGENSLGSIGAPRRARAHVRMSEQTTGLADEGDQWPPPVVGQVRLRLLTEVT